MTDYYTCRECNGYTLHCGCYEARQATVKQTLTIQPVSNSYKFDPDAFSQWIDDGCPEGVSGMPEAANFLLTAWNTRATDAENQRLRAEVEALREALGKAQNPLWFYHPDYTEVALFNPHEVIDDYYDPEPGKHVFEIECARPLPSIWCAVHCLTDAEHDAMDTDERFIVTEHASEEEARAALTRKDAQ